MVTTLLTTRRFAPLFACQFLSAFNDNFLKNALVLLILYRLGGSGAETLVTLAGGIFIAPFFFLSGLGGQLADRYDKAKVAQWLKLAEIGAAALSVAGFWLHSIPVLFAALALFGVIAALFGPVKYGILPDHLRPEELGTGNALVEGATFLAILFGTVAGGLATTVASDAVWLSALVMIFAVLCWLSARLIPSTRQAAPDLPVQANIFASTGALLRDLWSDGRLWRCAVYSSWFWLVGAAVLALLPSLVKTTFNGDEHVVTLLLALFAIGIAIGSGVAAWVAGGRVVLLPVVIGAVLMGLFGFDVGWTSFGYAPGVAPLGVSQFLHQGTTLRAGIDFFVMAMAGGLFIVPAFTALQAWSDERRRARTIAAVNVLNAAFMVGGTLVLALLQAAGLHVPALFCLIGLCNLVAAVVVLRTLPTRPFRDLLHLVYRVAFRLEVRGTDNIAKAGPNCIVAMNHVSFLDAGLALALLDHDPVFAIDSGIAQRWWVKPFLHLTRAMPLDPLKPLATRTLINAVKGGDTLVIFPEGRISVTGALMKVYDGVGLIADRTAAPVLPVRIDGLEQTPFSRLSGREISRHWWPKVVVTILEPVRLQVDEALVGRRRRQAAGAALYTVMSDLVFRTSPVDHSVPQALMRAARKHGMRRMCLEDPLSGPMTSGRLLLGMAILGRKLMPLAPEGHALGVMLPNVNGTVVTVFALMSAGRVPAMINFSAGLDAVLSACRTAEVTTVLTSRAFLEKGKLEKLADGMTRAGLSLVFLDDVRNTIGTSDKLRGIFDRGRPLVARKADDPAAILFTSGSEGTPKGVVLSHRNMLSNVAQVAARIDFGRADKVFDVLPMFHSFGLTAALVLPLVSGAQVYLYPSPLHYRMIPELIYSTNATVMFGTDTFLAGYARFANSYDLRSLRYLVAGAEPVKEATRRLYLEKFGLRILEGYGVTETGPVLAVNTPMFNRFGSVGRVLPGIETRLDPVPGIEAGGRLQVRGPNVMLGYLKADRPGELQPPEGGWHDTGDIVEIDDQKFVTIKGRAKRFAKVGGEMVSLAAIEVVAAALWTEARSVAATVPDPRKGERIVLVTEQPGADRAAFLGFAKSRHLPEIAMPSEIVGVTKLPELGGGKLDLMGVQAMVRARAEGGEAA
ncbi:acyl-[ACP]--phospholipid O-acyltransferase [Lichenihabitans sp. Uapishka_5]|uniref:acyl-[ACP]--phospholipid O-acyltransferase n=1 Tax=Lichenihabitans sp. Uapishka_5 TaxID=3037302 RepID=UPI0029E7F16E|nr:acyl-[ACP]--phospholipid O-acyltransferase [Lichenihabitans sp. Uapishka_5]MDX7950695.1 acyl-[ACP]--phospholipid O-acyltransferase [Lichenihabitans sp. Uapishka_5]